MARTITEIYKEYRIVPSLQLHMLRVAAVAYILCDNLDEVVDKNNVVLACLLHDMGNIIKFKMDVMPEFFNPEGVEYWQRVKDEYIAKYGTDEHHATLDIVKELNLSHKIVEFINVISFLDGPKVVFDPDFNHKIMLYCDNRVSPFGVVSMEDRLLDFRKRYAHLDKISDQDSSLRLAFESGLREIEKQIFQHCKINREDITDEAVAPIIEELKHFVIE